MKQLLTVLFVLFLGVGAMAQSPNPYPKTINVTGSAETEIVPDEIYVVVTLKEYDKKGGGKIALEKIKTDFLGFCRSIGLPDSVISIAQYQGTDNNWWRKRKRDEKLYSSIGYQVKFSSSKKMDELVAKLDEDATEDFRIERLAHSQIADYRAKLKVEAIRAARNKAGYMAEAIGEQLGVAVTITEPGENPGYMYGFSQANMFSNTRQESQESNSVDFRKIKLRYEINAIFALR